VHFIRLNQTLITASNWAADGSEIYAFEDRTAISGRTYAYVLEAIDLRGGAECFPARWVTAGSPPEVALSIHPNPADRRTAGMTIALDLRAPGPVALTIYGARGERVRSLLDQRMGAGRHAVRWDGRDDRGRRVGAGVYLCRPEAGQRRLAEKLLILP